MLDVICSALGAVLILLILSTMAEQDAQAQAQAKDEQLEQLQRDLMKAQKKLKEARRPGGVAVGMCHTKAAKVEVALFDHGGADNDRVDISLNNQDFKKNVVLPDKRTPERFAIPLENGPNYLGATALNMGTGPPNTATVIITPCKDGNPEHFTWNMQTGQKRHISIVRD